MRKTYFVIAFVLVVSAGWCQQVSITSALDTNRILIGEQTVLHLKASNLPTLSGLVWPAWPDTLSGVEVLSSSRDTLENKGFFNIEEHFVLTSFDSGFVVIPPFAINLDEDQFETEPQILNVGTVEISSDQDYFDIKDPVNPPFDFLYWFKKLWFVSLILAIILVVVLYLWLKKKKEKKAIEVAKDLRTPAERARDNLTAIRDQRIWQDGHVKNYYSSVTDTVRTYLEESFPVPAMEMVSDELLEAMQTHVSTDVQKLLRNMLLTADLVKFAKSKPGPDQHTQIWDDAMKIVELTEPKTLVDES